MTSSIITHLPLDVPISHASSSSSSILPEKNSTLLNSSATDFESAPITTIIIPNEGSSLVANSRSNNVTNLTNQDEVVSSSFSSTNRSSVLTEYPSNLTSFNDTLNTNVSNDVANNDTLSDPQQRGNYLVDDNGFHYYNINNCSEKKGSSGIGDMSECEDAAKEMSEE
ncbi:MAG: hypothetical protein L0H55_05370 [Candidatus Nitrosocosmicus sp.]|nr:hypothetical protein [Candidatus Nitrosocosmicus sp.]